MKKLLPLLFCTILVISFTNTQATIRRVGFTDLPPLIGVDYISFYLAHQAANNGDTILVWPGVSLVAGWPNLGSFASIPISKRLIIISKGSWLDPNSNPRGNSDRQATIGTATIGRQLDFRPGSDGSVLMGFDAGSVNVVITANNITIKRNKDIPVYLNDLDVNNITLEGNYQLWFTGNDNSNNKITNIIIRNNFIEALRFPIKKYSGVIENNTWAFDNAFNGSNGGAGTMSNPLLGSSTAMDIILWDGTWLFQNNLIISHADISGGQSSNYFNIQFTANATFNNNVALVSRNVSLWPTNGTGNIFIPVSEVANIFEAFPAISASSGDGRYQLKVNGSAKAHSSLRPNADVDAGMFGGNNPYKLSTIPSIPTIYKIGSLQGNNPTGNTIQVNISTRSNN